MALTSGTLLGPYEILAPIGAGGMGEVYRARDTRLDRTVAVKVLPPHLADDPDLRERFEREARAVSSLNHPHICALYDIGEAADVRFLVMELLEGQTLADRLQKGALPIADALRYAIEIAGALNSAHRRGIVHRDLKPGNVMLTATGTKLLDFGLAKTGAVSPLKPAMPSAPAGFAPTAVPTSPPLTMAGTILGTLQYMSPEQIEGKDSDARSDIFAFGALVHEMVTGRRAFEGKSQVGLIAAIVEHDPPPVSSLQPVSPPLLDHLVTTCLAKDPEHRWQTIADVLIQLKLIAERGGQLVTAAAAPPSNARARLAWATAAALAVVSAALGTLAIRGTRRPEAARVTFELNMWTGTAPLHIALSPDGTRLVAASTSDKGPALWMRTLASANPQPIPGTEGVGAGNGGFPFWSPDGRFVAFFGGGKLKRVDIFGAPPQTICDAPVGNGGTWNRDGVIVFAPNASGPLLRVAAVGGMPAPLTQLDASRQETAHRHPWFLPDGRHFLFVAVSATRSENNAIFVGSLESKERKRLVSSVTKAAFAPPNHLLFMREGTLMAQQFDPGRLEFQGDPFPVAEGVGINLGNSAAGFSVSNDETLAYRTGSVGFETQVTWRDRAGKEAAKVGVPAAYREPALAPDLQHIAISRTEGIGAQMDGGGDLWIVDEVRGTNTRFTFGNADNRAPVWSPGGEWIVFASNRDGGIYNLYQKNAGSVGTEEVLLKSDHSKLPEDWSADGRFLLYRDIDTRTGADLWVLPMTGDRKPQPVLRTPFTEQQGRFSSDGRWIAYVSNESGVDQVYVQSFPVPGAKYQISTSGGVQPMWRKDGRELFFISGNSPNQVMSVDIDSSASALRAGVAKPLFTTVLISRTRQRNSWAAAPDGQRFLINGPDQQDSVQRPITVVLNWLAGTRPSQ